MVSPSQRQNLQRQAMRCLQFWITIEFNMRLREAELTREARAKLNRISDIRRRAQTRMNRRQTLRAAH